MVRKFPDTLEKLSELGHRAACIYWKKSAKAIWGYLWGQNRHFAF
jgi:hypothetical protein